MNEAMLWRVCLDMLLFLWVDSPRVSTVTSSQILLVHKVHWCSAKSAIMTTYPIQGCCQCKVWKVTCRQSCHEDQQEEGFCLQWGRSGWGQVGSWHHHCPPYLEILPWFYTPPSALWIYTSRRSGEQLERKEMCFFMNTSWPAWYSTGVQDTVAIALAVLHPMCQHGIGLCG